MPLEREQDMLVASPPSTFGVSHSAECDQGFHPMDPAAFEKAGETFDSAKRPSGQKRTAPERSVRNVRSGSRGSKLGHGTTEWNGVERCREHVLCGHVPADG